MLYCLTSLFCHVQELITLKLCPMNVYNNITTWAAFSIDFFFATSLKRKACSHTFLPVWEINFLIMSSWFLVLSDSSHLTTALTNKSAYNCHNF
jgi:hypothetical protein